jgi:hypothetical protein
MKILTITEQQDNNTFTFYDNYLGTILRAFEGFEYADVRESIDDVAGNYGATYITSKFGKRRVSISGDLIDSDIFAMRRRLARALRQTGTMKLITFTTYDDLALQFEAEVVKALNPYTHKTHSFLIEMIAPDWRFYSQTLKEQIMGETILRGGTSIPAIIPMSFPVPTDPATEINNIVINEGSETTDPIFTITGPGTDFTVGNVTTDQEFTLSSTLAGGDVIEIDVKTRSVIKNGTDNLYPDFTGDFWSLIPGENELRFFVGTDLTADTNLKVSYRDAYGGI